MGSWTRPLPPCGSVILNGNNLHVSGRREVIIAREFDVPTPESTPSYF